MIVAHKTGTLLAVNDYYPFGLRWNGQGSPFHKYQFGDKEYEEELNLSTYDFHARQMDPVLGRFWGVDPMSSERVSFSPFNYVQNNPMNRVDPSGMLDFEMNEYGDKISARSYSRAQSRLRGGFGSDEEIETMYLYENQSVLETQTSVGDGDKKGTSAKNTPGETFEGVKIYKSEIGDLKDGAAFTLPGIGIFVNPKDANNKDLLRHEFGHTLAASRYGYIDFYLVNVAVSLRSTQVAANHQLTWTENQANTLSYLYFNEPSDWNFTRYPIDQNYQNTLVRLNDYQRK